MDNNLSLSVRQKYIKSRISPIVKTMCACNSFTENTKNVYRIFYLYLETTYVGSEFISLA